MGIVLYCAQYFVDHQPLASFVTLAIILLSLMGFKLAKKIRHLMHDNWRNSHIKAFELMH